MGCVYMATNIVNGKRYVGKTIFSLEHRRSMHKNSAEKRSKCAFHCALKKYGIENFEWRIIVETDDDEELREFEIESIAFLHTKVPNGYNMTDGGDGTSGHKMTEETKCKISRKAKGRLVSKEVRRKMSEAQRGKVVSEETKQRMSEAAKAAVTPEIRAIRSRTHKGKFVSAETRKKLSESNKGKQAGEQNPFYRKSHSPESIEKMKEAQRKRPLCSKETREKIGAASRGRTYEERYGEEKAIELKMKRSLRHRGKTVSKETREKLRKANKGKKCGPFSKLHKLRIAYALLKHFDKKRQEESSCKEKK